VVVAAFALSRVGYYAAGVEFDSSPLGGYWQYIDPPLLRERLLESLWHLHSQPPLYNLFLGLVLKAAGGDYELFFQLVYLAAGLLLAVLLYRLMRRLGVGAWASAALAAVYAASPAAVLFETWLYVEELAALGLLGGAVLLHRFAERGRAVDAAGAFALLAAVALSRTLFHLVWLVGLVALVWVAQPGRRKLVLAAAAVPLALVLAVYVKNLVLYDTLSSTSCSGINAARVTTNLLPEAERRRLVRAGELSRFALESPFAVTRTVPEAFRREPRRGIPLLDRRLKASGAPNFDHAAYLRICDEYLDDALTVLRKEPGTYSRAVRQGSFIFWRPPSQYPLFDRDNRETVQWLERAYGLVFYGQLNPAKDLVPLAFGLSGDYSVGRRIGEVAWFALLGYLLAAGFAAAVLWRALRERRASPLALACAYALWNIAWVTLVGIGFEAGENNRFRYLTDPLALALVAALATRALARWRQRRAAPATRPPPP
jgi:hypothetical protein